MQCTTKVQSQEVKGQGNSVKTLFDRQIIAAFLVIGKILIPPLDSATPICYIGLRIFWRLQWAFTLTFEPSTLNTSRVYRLWYDQTLYQILSKLNFLRRICRDSKIKNSGRPPFLIWPEIRNAPNCLNTSALICSPKHLSFQILLHFQTTGRQMQLRPNFRFFTPENLGKEKAKFLKSRFELGSSAKLNLEVQQLQPMT